MNANSSLNMTRVWQREAVKHHIYLSEWICIRTFTFTYVHQFTKKPILAMYVIMGHRGTKNSNYQKLNGSLIYYTFSFERTVSIFIKNIFHIIPILRITILVWDKCPDWRIIINALNDDFVVVLLNLLTKIQRPQTLKLTKTRVEKSPETQCRDKAKDTRTHIPKST